MKNIELYDIISLKNGTNYTVLKKLEEGNKKYYLLAKIDEFENPDISDIKIVEEITNDGKKMIKEVEDHNIIDKIEKLYSESKM